SPHSPCRGVGDGRIVPPPNSAEHATTNDCRELAIDASDTITLWRPTGQAELDLVAASGWQAWPPRLPDQPIFYPVLNRWYATKSAASRLQARAERCRPRSVDNCSRRRRLDSDGWPTEPPSAGTHHGTSPSRTTHGVRAPTHTPAAHPSAVMDLANSSRSTCA